MAVHGQTVSLPTPLELCVCAPLVFCVWCLFVCFYLFLFSFFFFFFFFWGGGVVVVVAVVVLVVVALQTTGVWVSTPCSCLTLDVFCLSGHRWHLSVHGPLALCLSVDRW